MEYPDKDQAKLNSQAQKPLIELAQVFLKLGLIGFGGPAAHIAMIDQEVVTRRQWMSREKLLDLLGITNLIPGPNSTELAIHIGYERAGWRGLIVAGSCFIFPAMMIVWLFAVIYSRYQTLPQAEWLLYGIKPVIIGIIIQALWKLGQKAVKDFPTSLAGIFAMKGYFLGLNEIFLLFLLGFLVMLRKNWQKIGKDQGFFLIGFSSLLSQVNPQNSLETSVKWTSIFLFFLKIGLVLYGSGYVLLAFLQRELVETHQWLTSDQLLDGIAVGQLTPGPLFTTATFIGYLLGGNAGAIAGTFGIFLPSFIFVLLVHPWVTKLRQSSWTSGFLDGINAASLGLMAAVLIRLTQSALIDWLTIIVAVSSTICLFRCKINSAWLVLIGASIGFLTNFFHFSSALAPIYK